MAPENRLVPPAPRRQPSTRTIHGRELVDDYAWLQRRDDPAVTAHLRSENDFADQVTAPLASLRAELYREMLGHIQETDDTVPYRDGAFLYYQRTEKGRQYAIHCRRMAPDGPEQVILDPNILAEGLAFLAVGIAVVSDDGRWLAFTVDRTGYRQYTLHIKDLTTGRLQNEHIERVNTVVWAADNRTLFYVTEDPVTKRQDHLFRHVVGEPDSVLLYHESDALYDLDVSRSRDRAFVFLEACSKTSSEVRFVAADTPTAPWRIVVPRSTTHEYDVTHRAGRFYLRTNLEAKNFRVVSAPVADPSPARWTELVAHRPSVHIEGLDLFSNHAVLSTLEGGLEHIEVVDFATGRHDRLDVPEEVYAVAIGTNREFDTTRLRYVYQSMATPPSTFEIDLTSRERTLLKETPVPGGFSREDYVCSRTMATAGDGTAIPISLVRRRDVRRDGSAPLLLYAYGSYGIAVPPSFSPARLALLDRGVVYAIAHVRGGGELGEDWREQGRMMTKLNTFTDFISCAEHLVATGQTRRDRLVIQGGSAGGMLVGGVVNMRPDLFRAAIAQVPFVDVVNTMLDEELPLTTSEYLEWGDPHSPEAFEYMLRYSPYDNVVAQPYPALLVWVAVHDSQVPYWEGAKFVAKIRSHTTGDQPVLLKVNFGAGHGGASGRYDALRETAYTAAFTLWQMGLAP